MVPWDTPSNKRENVNAFQPLHFRCMGDFTDEEQATLGQVFNGVAHAECFDYSFMEGCTDYMDAMMDDMAGMTTETITG